jgi:plasmid stability protein
MAEPLHIPVDDELNARIRRAARRRHASTEEWARSAIGRALAEEQRLDPVTRLASLNAPTADLDTMLQQIEAGRF